MHSNSILIHNYQKVLTYTMTENKVIYFLINLLDCKPLMTFSRMMFLRAETRD